MSDLLAGYIPGWAAEHRARTGRPYVTVTYAQSLDGSLSFRRGERTPISGSESKRITHALRAAHDAILVGIETVLADDPRLTAHHVGGPDPQPVVLDSCMRFPLGAQLLEGARGVWIATTERANRDAAQALAARGARIIYLPSGADGRIDLAAFLDQLGKREINSLMVEGGGQVISSFLRSRLADRLVLTIAPVLAAGYPAVAALDAGSWEDLPRLRKMEVMTAGGDLIVWGDLA